MNQIFLVTQREYFNEIRKKSFILMTLAVPFLMMAFVSIVVFLGQANQETMNIAVVDESGYFASTFHSTEKERYEYRPVEDLRGMMDTLQTSDFLQGILHIPKTDSSFQNLKSDIDFAANKSLGISQISKIQSKLSERLEFLNLKKKGISEEILEKAKVNVKLNVTQQTASGETQKTNETLEAIKSVFSGILMYATFTFIMMYGVRVMRSVLEEKNNRVVEIIISSVKPFNLMMGKILGTTLVAITQFAIWIALILFLMSILPLFLSESISEVSAINPAAAQVESFPEQVNDVIQSIFTLNIPLIISVFFIYFFLGYIFYSSFFAAIGASVENDSETQQFMWVGIMPLLLGVYGSLSIFENPDGPVGFWFSMIPFTSPVTMMARITYGVPYWQLIVSIAILILSVISMVWFASKIYRVGILMYGKKPSLKEWMKWLRY
ncbi:ABC-2 family transporter protein [Candidatus Ornithobacterium hominis]|uniref:ABC transporter permease n=1 Tax=Candidatus Ornithobacterium hominis TaxID=2497989 RepID=UPI0024BD2881|nr:ABC transporter permease [Candidatus Ornithobacterium hominis]CAI9429003.1 ABC-2 family transporter protein [Candidatus Ornithobacterium hominis]